MPAGESAGYAEALRFLARIEDDRYRKSRYEEDAASADMHRTRAVDYFSLYVGRMPETEFGVYAKQRIADLTVAGINDPAERLRRGRALYGSLAGFGDPVLQAFGAVRLASIELQAGNPDSLLAHVGRLRSIDTATLDPDMKEDVLYTAVRAAEAAGLQAATAEAGSRYIAELPNGRHIPDVYYRCTRSLSERGDTETAVLWLRALWERCFYSDYVDSSRMLYGDLLLQQDDPAGALTLYQQEMAALSVESEKSAVAALLLKIAEANKALNDYEQAADNYRQYILMSDSDADIAAGYLELGSVFADMFRTEDAVAAMRQAAKKAPGSETALKAGEREAELLFSSLDYEQAGAKYKELSQESVPDSLRAYFEYSYLRCLYLRDRRVPANEERNRFQSTFRNRPRNEMNEYMGILRVEEANVHFRVPRYDDAEDILRDVIKDYPNTQAAQYAEYSLGLVLLSQPDKADEGVSILNGFSKKYKESPFLGNFYFSYGSVLLNVYENARDAFVQLANAVRTPQHRNNPRTHQLYIEVSQRSGFIEDAITAVKTYVDHFPNAEDRMNQLITLGELYMTQRRYDEAIAHFKSIMQAASPRDEIFIQQHIGDCYYESGRYALAIAEYMRLLLYGTKSEEFPVDIYASAKYYTALAFEQLGNLDKAIEYLNQIIRETGNPDFRQQAEIVKARVEAQKQIRKQ